MAFRLMRYAIAAMQRHLDKGHTQLPLVIPLLFYHGRVSPPALPDVLAGRLCRSGHRAAGLW